MTPGRLDLEVPRNGGDARSLQMFGADADGNDVALDLTGYNILAQARDVFGGVVIATASAAITDHANGIVSLRFMGAQFDGYGDVFATVAAGWDLKLIAPDGLPEIPLRGVIYITPEATA